jgi:type IV pilus assembly protein PilW
MSFAKLHSGASARPQRGLTLVELMISITLGLVVIGGVLYMYLSSKGSYRTSKSTSRAQEAGRVGLDAVLHDIREAGYIGCGSRESLSTYMPLQINQTAVPQMSMTDPTQAVFGYSASGYTAGSTNSWASTPVGTSANPQWIATGGDVLVIRVATSSPVRMVSDSNTTTPALFVADNCARVSTGDYVIASSCTSATILRVSNVPPLPASPTACPVPNTGTAISPGVEIDYATKDVNGNAVNSSTVTPQAFPYKSLGSVQTFDEYTYYVGQLTGRPWPALYRLSFRQTQNASWNGVSEEVVDHVQSMSVYYGVDPGGGNPIAYYAASAMTPSLWPSVTNIRIQLLTAGDDLGVATLPQPALAFGAPNTAPSFTPTDTRYWQVFTGVAALRDRLN